MGSIPIQATYLRVINTVFIPFSLLHFKSSSWICFGSNLTTDPEIKRSQKRRLCSTGRIELLQLWGFGEGTTSTHENHMVVVCREVPVSRDFPVSWEEDEIIDAAVKETRVIQGYVTWGIPSRDVLISSDEALVEFCVRQLQHQTLQLLKKEFNARTEDYREKPGFFSHVKGKQQTSSSHIKPQH